MLFFKKKRKICQNLSGRPRKDVSFSYIWELKQKGYSNYRIAKELKCSESTIRKRLKEMQQPKGKFSPLLKYGEQPKKEHKGD